MSVDEPEPGIARLVQQLADQTSRLVRAEIALAKAELAQKAKLSGAGIGLFAGAGAIVLYALGVFIWAAVFGVGEALPLWASALIIGGAMVLLAGGLVSGGIVLLKRASTKPETIDRLKADIETIKAGFASDAGAPPAAAHAVPSERKDEPR